MLGSVQPSIHSVLGSFPRCKTARA
jgi:hypothetical protein